VGFSGEADAATRSASNGESTTSRLHKTEKACRQSVRKRERSGDRIRGVADSGTNAGMRCGIGECARQEDADSSAWSGGAGRGIVEPNLLEFAIVIQIAPQMRILVAIEAIDLRRGKVLRQRNTRKPQSTPLLR